MSAASKSCGSCGHANTVDAMFCSKCGTRLARDTSPQRPKKKAEAEPKKAEADPKKPPIRRRVAGAARTMVGVGMPGPPVEAPSEPPPEPDQTRRIAGSARTLMGVAAPGQHEVEEAIQKAKAETAAKAFVDETRPLVVDEPISAPVSEPSVAIPATAASMPVNPHSETVRDISFPSGAVPIPVIADAIEPTRAGPLASEPVEVAVQSAPTSEPPPRISRDLGPTNRTMLGQPAPKRGEPPLETKRSSDPGAARGRAAVVYPADTGEAEALKLARPRRFRLGSVLFVLGIVALIVVGIVATKTMLSGSEVRPSVVQGEGGEMLEIEVPGAADGTRVRFHGSEQRLRAGRARFPLSADDLALGDNELTVDVVSNGDVETHTIELHLATRVRADVGALSSDTPAIDVVVEAPPGSYVTLDGERLALDGHGRGTRRFPIHGAIANAEGMIEHVVRYRIQPPEGSSEQGQLSTRIPRTTMQIDRPGQQVVTDADSIVVAGAVAPSSTVTVAGRRVDVHRDRFLTTHRLGPPGEHTIEVVARAPGKAPNVVLLTVRRVLSLAAEASRFTPDPELTYARIAQNPTSYRGQRVAFEGLVYNVDVRNGQSVLQILVNDCPSGDRCPLWVTYPAAADTELRSRVRVLGTIAGEQQFRSQSGQVRTVPRVDATFVLPSRSAAP